MIGIDWGITHLRAYRIGPDGTVIEARDEAKGVMAAADGAFETCPYRKSNPELLMVQTSEVRDGHDAAKRLNCRRRWRILVQR